MKPSIPLLLLALTGVGLLTAAPGLRAEGEDETAWNTVLKPKLFAQTCCTVRPGVGSRCWTSAA